ncbi:MAG: SagB/ThcOx family dehydrogenase [Candidatus Yanofskybacteria bacterium]|nr:SagB/ThcOx family dehydrogenase [Candidatus Yanofskybacteria bacterium]
MDKSVRLFVAAYAFSEDGATHFLLPGREVKLEGAEEVLPILLRQCDGYRMAEEIVSLTAEETGYAQAELWELVEQLLARQVLIGSTQHYLFFHRVSANPMPFSHQFSEEEIARMLAEGESFLMQSSLQPTTSLEKLLARRESTREFTGEFLSQQEAERLAWAIYGKTPRANSFPESAIGLGTVPSGGALYPLRLFVLKPSNKEREWECFRAGSEGLEKTVTTTYEALVRVFLNDSNLLEGVGAVYVLACEFQQTTQKYANRGYRYAILEAGHAAQNAYLWCVEQGLGVVEVGGFYDEELAQLLSLSYPDQAPLTTLLVGRRKQ